MSRIYTPEAEADLETQLQAKEEAISEVATRMSDAQASDTEWDAARQEEYNRDQLLHGQLCREHGVLSQSLENMRWFKTPDRLPSMEKNEALEELEAFLRGKTKGNHDGDARKHTFDISLIAEANRAQMLTRSDNASGSGATEVRTQPTVIDSLSAFGNGMKLPSMIMTADGNTMSYPVTDNSSAMGEMLADEGTVASSQDLADISSVNLTVKRFSSKQMPVSNTMIRDSVFNITGYALTQSTRRLGRIISSKAVTGAGGANDIEGIVGKAKVHTLASRTAFAFVTECIDMQQSLDRAYLQGEGGFGAGIAAGSGLTSRGGFTGWAISYEMEGLLKKATETDSGRPLWQPSVTQGAPNMLFGYPYIVVDEMDAPLAQNRKPIMFGNFNYFCGRLVGDMSISQFYDSGTAPGDYTMFLGFVSYGQRSILKDDSASKNEAVVVANTP